MTGRDCKNCVNCDFTRGFMCTCHYSYDENEVKGTDKVSYCETCGQKIDYNE